MSVTGFRPLAAPGERAPDFTLPRADRDGTVSLADYRGRSPLLLGLFRGVSCAFCRRALVQLDQTAERLRGLGIETLAIVATSAADARLYFRYRPARLALAADPELATHRAYGLPRLELPWEVARSTPVDPSGDLPAPLPLWDAVKALSRLDGFEPTASAQEEARRNWTQSAGEFLIDRAGVVRWAYVEYATGDLTGAGKFPTDDAILAAARPLAR